MDCTRMSSIIMEEEENNKEEWNLKKQKQNKLEEL